MLNLKEYRSKAAGLADLLNWGFLIDPGIVLGKDGSLLAGFFYRGPDTLASSPNQRNYLTARINAVLSTFGSGWVIWQDAARFPVDSYIPRQSSHFPDPISSLVDREREAQFTAEDQHYVTEHSIVFQYTPPLKVRGRVLNLIYDDDAKDKQSAGDRSLIYFKRKMDEFENLAGAVLALRRMGALVVTDALGRDHAQDELVNYLQFTLTGEPGGLNLPPYGSYLDAVLGGIELYSGETPRLGNKFIGTVAIEGYPAESYPGILEVLDTLAIPYRWSTRFIYLDAQDAVGDIERYRKKWKFKQRGFVAQVLNIGNGAVNEDAALMTAESQTALGHAESGLVTYGYYTPVVVLMDKSRDVCEDQARMIAREISRLGFTARLETVNCMESWHGSLPGHNFPNVRRPLIHTLNLADLLPLSSVWAGEAVNPCPFYPAGSPCLLYAATGGSTPMRLNLHVDDTGHTLIFGPTGAGKSVLLATVALSFLRYPGATICAFDKGRSMLATALATGGRHYDLNADGGAPSLCPLASLDTDTDLAWAAEWLETCCQLQMGVPPSPGQRAEIIRSLNLLRESPGRSLTDFCATCQDRQVKEAMEAYTLSSPIGRMLDSRHDSLFTEQANFRCFELEDLLGMGDKTVIPVLLYLFRQFEKSLKGQPAILILDEAWIMLGHPVFRDKIKEWLKTLRRANCCVVMATQSLSDAVRSGLVDVLQESCPRKIFLPNEEANKGGSDQVPGPRDLYEAVGLTETEIEIIQTAVRKREYYVTGPDGRRLVSLSLGPVALSFVGASSKPEIAAISALASSHGSKWPFYWLQHKGVNYENYLK